MPSISSLDQPKELWVIQKNLLTAHSLFFHCTLLSDFREAHNDVFTLPEDDPDISGLCVRWLYVGRHQCLDDDTLLQSAKAWILGEKLGATAFQIMLSKASSPNPTFSTSGRQL